MIVLHTMVGTVAGSTAHFKNPAVPAAAHYGVGFNGSITQWIPENVTCYHANNYLVNQRSVGIEHEDMGNGQAVRPDALYEASARLVADIARANNIPLDREHVKKHNEISATACPGSLDVDRILRRAKELLVPTPEEEKEHTYMLKPSVFVNMVTKSSEYDELWKKLELEPSLKGRSGSHQLILDLLSAKISEARQAQNQNADSTPASPATVPENDTNVPTGQPKSVWKKDVLQVLKDILGAIKGR